MRGATESYFAMNIGFMELFILLVFGASAYAVYWTSKQKWFFTVLCVFVLSAVLTPVNVASMFVLTLSLCVSLWLLFGRAAETS